MAATMRAVAAWAPDWRLGAPLDPPRGFLLLLLLPESLLLAEACTDPAPDVDVVWAATVLAADWLTEEAGEALADDESPSPSLPPKLQPLPLESQLCPGP